MLGWAITHTPHTPTRDKWNGGHRRARGGRQQGQAAHGTGERVEGASGRCVARCVMWFENADGPPQLPKGSRRCKVHLQVTKRPLSKPPRTTTNHNAASDLAQRAAVSRRRVVCNTIRPLPSILSEGATTNQNQRTHTITQAQGTTRALTPELSLRHLRGTAIYLQSGALRAHRNSSHNPWRVQIAEPGPQLLQGLKKFARTAPVGSKRRHGTVPQYKTVGSICRADYLSLRIAVFVPSRRGISSLQ